MALIDCPECHKRISETCPHCGYMLTPDVVTALKEKESKTVEAVAEAASGYDWFSNLIVIGFGVMLCWLMCATNSPTVPPSAREREIRRISDTYGIDIVEEREAKVASSHVSKPVAF